MNHKRDFESDTKGMDTMIPEGFVSSKGKAKGKAPKSPAKGGRKPAKQIARASVPGKPKTAIDPSRGGGGPVYVATAAARQKVEQFAGLGNSVASIASMLEISEATVKRYHAEDIERGVAKANTNVAAALYGKAMKGDVNAQKFFLGARAGWRAAGGLDIGAGGLTIHISADDAAL